MNETSGCPAYTLSSQGASAVCLNKWLKRIHVKFVWNHWKYRLGIIYFVKLSRNGPHEASIKFATYIQTTNIQGPVYKVSLSTETPRYATKEANLS